MFNTIERNIPEEIFGLGTLPLFDSNGLVKNTQRSKDRIRNSDRNKILDSLETAIRETGLRDGMTISFHHHFRNGDYIINMVLNAIARMGIKDLTIAPSSLIDIHAPLINHIKNGVIRRIETSGLRGELAEAISNGLMNIPVVINSHGGRARAIASGELPIDVTFLGVPSCDPAGNANGYSRDNSAASECGSLGYAKVDAQYAKKVVLITDHLVEYPNTPFGIPESHVDYIVVVDAIGDPKGIMSGATRFTKNPKDLLIAQSAADVIAASGYFEDGFSLQTGSGGASLAATRFLREKMIERNIKASFALGGITGQMVDLHEEGLIKKLLDVQGFDLKAVASLKNNRFHQQICAEYYASPDNQGSAVNQLDVTVLSALEIDLDFNVNVITGSDGVIRGASGGHSDSAAGAACSIIVAPLIRGRMPSILDRVHTVVTPGCSIDVLVTEQGIAVNPLRKDLYNNLKKANLPVVSIEELKAKANQIVGIPESIKVEDNIVGVVKYRDGSVIDVIHQVKKDAWK
ncbi:citrate lyase subunit alpha [Neobacillus sp. OS1-33]|jgi:citrate lyase subunit alpha/citrate CoA-transferase|uniref:citrate lyase subunit alpha n=1 Tax=Neobacillus sp. OS1-33 TaxID=3070683 RepID=UPI0027DF0234|nr:citrate lyase subunit alpha [Neobacillus sp. OS1-33]WML23839.1 citrate lyase subunit alpha [Neobacillus sp. OS1-33]